MSKAAALGGAGERRRCPACGGGRTMQTGESPLGYTLRYACLACGHRWRERRAGAGAGKAGE